MNINFRVMRALVTRDVTRANGLSMKLPTRSFH